MRVIITINKQKQIKVKAWKSISMKGTQHMLISMGSRLPDLIQVLNMMLIFRVMFVCSVTFEPVEMERL